jgi:hypothetical protein
MRHGRQRNARPFSHFLNLDHGEVVADAKRFAKRFARHFCASAQIEPGRTRRRSLTLESCGSLSFAALTVRADRHQLSGGYAWTSAHGAKRPFGMPEVI